MAFCYTIILKTKKHSPPRPFSPKIPLHKGNLRGHSWLKTVPQPRPNSAPLQKPGDSFCVYANGRLG